MQEQAREEAKWAGHKCKYVVEAVLYVMLWQKLKNIKKIQKYSRIQKNVLFCYFIMSSFIWLYNSCKITKKSIKHSEI